MGTQKQLINNDHCYYNINKSNDLKVNSICNVITEVKTKKKLQHKKIAKE